MFSFQICLATFERLPDAPLRTEITFWMQQTGEGWAFNRTEQYLETLQMPRCVYGFRPIP